MRVLIVDDHELVRCGIRSLLSTEAGCDVCGEAVDGRDAIDKAAQLNPDVIVMDISMPNLNGLEATREIKRVHPSIEVVIVTQHESQEMARQAFSAGARGYVVKSSLSQDLLTALRTIIRREPFLDAKALSSTPSMDAHEILQRSAAFEGALREALDYNLAVLNNMAEGLYTVNSQGLLTSINPAAEAMFGWAKEELLGKKMHDITHFKHPDGTPFPASDCPGLHVLQEGVALREHEDTFIRKDGSFFPVVFSASPLRKGGETVGVVVGFRDDTERRREREALRQTEQHFELVTNRMAAAVSRCSRDFRYLWANQAYADWIKRPLHEISGHRIVEVLGTEAFEGLRPYFERALAGERVAYERETTFQGIGRRWISAVYTPTFNRAGVADGWVAVILDVTDRKEMESARAQQARLLDLSFDAIIVRDSGDRIVYWNKGAEEVYGWTKTEALGQILYELLKTIYPVPREEIFASLAKEGRWQGELTHTRKDGTHVIVMSRWATIRHTEKGQQWIMEINADISERKRAEQDLRNMVQTLEEKVLERTHDLTKASDSLRELSAQPFASAGRGEKTDRPRTA